MKLNKIWGYGQLFGFSAYEGKNRYQDDHILMTMKEDLCFRYEFKEHYLRASFINKKDKVSYDYVMSDFVLAKINQNKFILTFADNDTLVGISPNLMTFTSETSLKKIKYKNTTIYQIDHHYLTLIYQKINKTYKFVIHHSLNLNDAKKDLKRYLNVNLDALVKHYIDYYKKMPKCKDNKYESLYYKCLSVNKVNTHTKEGKVKYFWTTPDRVPHRHMWLWDTGFHALMMAEFNIKKAEESVLAMLTQMKPNGFLPHMANPNDMSDITQPCILSWVCYKLYQKSHNIKFLKAVAPYLNQYLTYDIKYRDENKNGLLEWKTDPNDKRCKCGESGLDNSPRFDFDNKMDCIDFSSYLALDSKYLSLIYKAINNPKLSKKWNETYLKVAHQINKLMYDEQDGVYYDYLFNHKLTKCLTPTSFLPLFVGIMNKEQVKKMVKVLFDKNLLNTPLPFASISRKHKQFSNDMWRGGVWLNINYFLIVGLKQYGYIKEAKEIRDKTLNAVNKWYQKTGCIFEFYDPMNKVSPFYCKRKGSPLKEPDYRKHVHSISDYHWSAAFTYLLIQNNY